MVLQRSSVLTLLLTVIHKLRGGSCGVAHSTTGPAGALGSPHADLQGAVVHSLQQFSAGIPGKGLRAAPGMPPYHSQS
uniref:Secreted protein n=1 Tax=Knipowitschia caucasica TaxID=637954 RepID=A0AAV2LZT7_KNICA